MQEAETIARLLNQFTFLGSNISSTESDVNMLIRKAWTAIDKLSIIWKSDLSNRIKWEFFQAIAVSVLLYGCTSSILTNRLKQYGAMQWLSINMNFY